MRILSHSPGRSNAELARDVNVSPQAMNMVLRWHSGPRHRGPPASAASGRSLPAQLTREGNELLTTLDAAGPTPPSNESWLR